MEKTDGIDKIDKTKSKEKEKHEDLKKLKKDYGDLSKKYSLQLKKLAV